MKGITAFLAYSFAAMLFFLMASTAFARQALFHEGGRGECSGCHIMHKSYEEEHVASPDDIFLLKGSDPSSTCLACHAEMFRVLSGDGSAHTPGGDFFWLTRSYGESFGDRHGHNVLAADFGLYQDATLAVAPSDGSVSYQSAWLSCTSCHDPHGRTGDGNFRLLGGIGYKGGREAYGISFRSPPPVARSYSGEGLDYPAETDWNHTDYGSGMSEWCANCHSGFAGGGYTHPAGSRAKLGRIAKNYNAYQATGYLTGNLWNAYDRLVPFERGEEDPARLDPASTNGPDARSQVMCLTCHRAHASPFDSMTRWDTRTTHLTTSAVLYSAEAIQAYYGETIAERYHPNQQTLCNKCHVKDGRGGN